MKPILFNTEMVKAILDGRKTVTRRLMKTIPVEQSDCTHKEFFNLTGGTNEYACSKCGYGVQPSGHSVFKSPCQVGDILYIRETWRVGAWNEDASSIAVDYKSDNTSVKEWIHIEDAEDFERYWIQSTDDAEKAGLVPELYDCQYHWNAGEAPTRWRPSIHMPKEAARIFLRVMNVRVEKTGDMSIQDMINEGIDTSGIITTNGPIEYRVINRFEELWNSTVRKKDYDKYSLEANPWVWVIEFEQISKEDALKH